MSQDSNVQTDIQATFDGEIFTVSCDLSANPIVLPWGVELSGYKLVIGQEGILMGCLELREKILAAAESPLSVSPESLVAPE